ncbi:MAG: urea ABC transporter permease subunit UrtC, partial [Anaerolineae bacterium]|nr:urea ABC transporter permease subunit UrtC [Anaerolineae bacterium]
MTTWRRWCTLTNALTALGLGAVFLLPTLLSLIPDIPLGYVLYLVSLGLIYAIVALGLNLLFGYAG